MLGTGLTQQQALGQLVGLHRQVAWNLCSWSSWSAFAGQDAYEGLALDMGAPFFSGFIKWGWSPMWLLEKHKSAVSD